MTFSHAECSSLAVALRELAFHAEEACNPDMKDMQRELLRMSIARACKLLNESSYSKMTLDERGCFQAWLLNVHNARWGRFTDRDMKIPQFGERQGQYRNEFLQQLWEAWSARAKAGQ